MGVLPRVGLEQLPSRPPSFFPSNSIYSRFISSTVSQEREVLPARHYYSCFVNVRRHTNNLKPLCLYYFTSVNIPPTSILFLPPIFILAIGVQRVSDWISYNPPLSLRREGSEGFGGVLHRPRTRPLRRVVPKLRTQVERGDPGATLGRSRPREGEW